MQRISTFSFVEISTFFSVIEMYIKMSEISNFWLSVLISQVAPYRSYLGQSLHILSVWCLLHKMHNAFTYPLHYQSGFK